MTQNITVTPIPFKDQGSFLSKFFGREFALDGQNGVFSFMWALADDYKGGRWKHFYLSNGGFYMAPAEQKTYYLRVRKGFKGHVSSDAAGIVATVFTLNYLRGCTRGSTEQRFASLTSNLLRFAEGHPDAVAILSAVG